ncbi:MAG TPA: glycine betaine/L-proline ABC transporter ATP-binding protein [Methylomirabilota bacterium]|nr:glycine betaine/L-proline ABC transporter ATP-binding protein [Methylomirabilota bacterium]
MASDKGGNATTVAAMRAVQVRCRNVWKLYGRGAESFLHRRQAAPGMAELADAGLIPAVRAVSLDVHEGEIFVIMGLSGSGKSTLVRCMTRLVEPTDGEILFEGRDLLHASERELIELRRHKMGMVFQHFALLPHLTVIENVAFPLDVQGVPRAAREERARTVIELVGLRGREQYYPRQLSGGQQQRVGIARSLAVEPAVWFLDEPFSALDPLIRREMQDEFLRLQNVLRKTIVFITHDFDEAIRLADRIAIMQDGEIIQIGTPEDLVARPATAYVAEFTRDVQRAKVISAGALMRPCRDGATYATRVRSGDRAATFAAAIVASPQPFGVVDDAGRIVGEIERDVVIDLLAGRKPT